MKRRYVLIGGAALLSGCASAQVRSWQIAALPGQARGGAGQRIGVRSIGLPVALNQSGVPKPGGAYAAEAFANDQWAAPLAQLLQTAMVQDLAQRLPGDNVLADGGAIGAAADLLVEIQVLQFAPDAAGKVTLSAQLATRPAKQQQWQLQSFTATAPGGATAQAIAAAMSSLWGQAADRVAEMLS